MNIAPSASFDELPARLSLKEAARVLGVEYGTLLRWIAAGIGPKVFKVSRTRFIRKAALFEFIQANEE